MHVVQNRENLDLGLGSEKENRFEGQMNGIKIGA